MLSMAPPERSESRHACFQGRCQSLRARHREPRSSCARAALEALHSRAAPPTFHRSPRERLAAPACEALGDLERWRLLWERLRMEDGSLAAWALECLRLLALERPSCDRAGAHLAAALFSRAGAGGEALGSGLAVGCAASLWGLLSLEGAGSAPSPEARLALACLRQLDGLGGKPGAKRWLSAFGRALDPRLDGLGGEIGAKLRAARLEAECPEARALAGPGRPRC